MALQYIEGEDLAAHLDWLDDFCMFAAKAEEALGDNPEPMKQERARERAAFLYQAAFYIRSAQNQISKFDKFPPL